jgi:hypothetical protein
MKKMFLVSIACLAFAAIYPMKAAADSDWDKGPDRLAVTNAPAYETVTLATCGQFERFVPDLIITDAPADQTQTVYWVIGTLTNSVGAFVPSATVHGMAVTNVPAMFEGDYLICVPSGDTATTNKYWTSGRRWN